MTFRPGHEKTGGRKKGSVNKLTEEVRKLAKKFGPAAIDRLNEIMTQSEDERAAVAAAKELLERAYGRASQVEGAGDAAKVKIVITGDDAKL